MGYEYLFAPSDLALLHDWLQEAGELYMDLDRPHSGGLNNSLYFLESLPHLRRIISLEAHPEICCYIFRRNPFPIRGVLDEALLAAARKRVPDAQYFSILALANDPLGCFEQIGSGESHAELREEFARLRGKSVRIGQDPFDSPDASFANFFERPDEVFVTSFHKNRNPHVWKNGTGYTPFEADPARYLRHISFW